MVEWQSPEVLQLTGHLFAQLTIFTLGVYSWYFTLSLNAVEFPLVARKVAFQLAHIPYLIGRFSHLISLLAIVIANHMNHSPVMSCSGIGVMRLVSVTDNVALAAASTNLALRAIVLWNDHSIYLYAMRGICCVHFVYAVILGIVGVRDTWDPIYHTCTLNTDSARKLFVTFLIFTVCWDITILIMTILGLRRKELRSDSPLWRSLMTQGVAYATLTLVTCIPLAVVYVLELNAIMNIILLAPGMTVSIIASSAAASSLLGEHNDPRAEVKGKATQLHSVPSPTPCTTNPRNMLTTVIDLEGSGTSSHMDEPISENMKGLSSSFSAFTPPSGSEDRYLP